MKKAVHEVRMKRPLEWETEWGLASSVWKVKAAGIKSKNIGFWLNDMETNDSRSAAADSQQINKVFQFKISLNLLSMIITV